MEKRVEKMREMVKNRNKTLGSLCVMLNAFGYFMRRDSVIALAKNANQADFVQGFVTGLVIAADILLVAMISKNLAALKDEQKLVRLYNKMNDERVMKIEALAGKSTLTVGSILIVFLALAAALFVSVEAAGILLVTIFVLAVVKIISKVYYTRTLTGE